MLSVNPSMEDIPRYPQRTLQINPNLSSTDILRLNPPKAFRNHSPLGRVSYSSEFLPVTPPPTSNLSPMGESHKIFSLGSHANSSISLDHLPLPALPELSRKFNFLPRFNFEVLVLCSLWYGFSIVSANSTKCVLSQFSYPLTLTQFQFVFNAIFCSSLFAFLAVFPLYARKFPPGSIPDPQLLGNSLRRFLTPTSFIIQTTLPMGIFQFAGHITSHKATSMIPVSLVHTIKALSPITTVLIYRFFYKTQFKRITYITLVPLMCGIMLTCYKPKKAPVIYSENAYVCGLVYAFVSMLIFVSQNIFAKKRLTHVEPVKDPKALPSFNNGREKKLDKLTILMFCSIIGFIFTLPFYVISEFRNPHLSLSQLSLPLLALLALNGFSHFMQSLLAFSLLGTISTIDYSIANIMKRIVVIICAFIWESSFNFSASQTCGIFFTALGLYCYDKWGIERKK